MKRALLYILVLIIIVFIPLKSTKKAQVQMLNHQTKSIHAKIVEPKIEKKIEKKIEPKIKKKKIIKKKVLKKPTPPKPIEKKVEQVQEEKVVEKLIPKEEEVKPAPDTKQLLQSAKQNYFGEVYEVINKSKYYPKKSRKFRQEDSIPVSFVIEEDGTISAFKIVKLSQFKELNKAVEKMFKKIKKFTKPPQGIPTPLEMNLNIDFKL